MHLIDPLLTLIYPQFCASCGKLVERHADGPACGDCWSATKFFGDADLLCRRCGAFLAESASQANPECGQCTDHCYDIARAAGLYERAIRASVLHMKRVDKVPASVRDRMVEAFERLELPDLSVVMPVPLSKQRSLERGFNQAENLARTISYRAGLKLDAHSLVRLGDTPMHRAAMDKKARAATVKNAFNVVRPNMVQGENILLIDDLMTSGSTVSQCAQALKKSGAGRVIVLTLARAAS